jgi:regulatory protein
VRPSARGRAINYLARREHSAKELQQKLADTGYEQEEIQQALERLAQEGLQSDARFAESFLNARVQRGYGWMRIRMELQQRGVDESVISSVLNESDVDWFALAIQVRCKRFGEDDPEDVKARAKQQRFLQYRGFTHEQIKESFN